MRTVADHRALYTRSARVRGAVLLGVVAVGAAGGYGFGAHGSSVDVHVGRFHSGETEISVVSKDWTYAIPLDGYWRDAAGTWHIGTRPECLPPYVDGTVRFASVTVTNPDGPTNRPVVWVDCTGATVTPAH